MYIAIITTVVFIIWLAIALHSAPNFEESTGYHPQCFNCNETDCTGCKVVGPCYACADQCSVDCPFDPILGWYKAEGGYYFNKNGEIIGTYTKGD